MQYSATAASQSVMGDNLDSAPAGVAAPERSASQPSTLLSSSLFLVLWELILKIKGRTSIRAVMTATRR